MRFWMGGGSKGRKLFVAPSPADEKTRSGGSEGRPYCGSKDESFFDSRAWLDSDCEDDFYSVNGEFTPSRGSTPNHQISTPLTPRLSKTFIETIPDTTSEPSPRKKLSELLQETLAGDEEVATGTPVETVEANIGSNLHAPHAGDPPKSLQATPHVSRVNSFSSSPKTPKTDAKSKKEKTAKAMHCCLPNVVPSFSIYDRKKQAPSRELRNGG